MFDLNITFPGGSPSGHIPRRQGPMRAPEDPSSHGIKRRGGSLRPGAEVPHQSAQHTAHGETLLRDLRDKQDG